MKSKKWFFVGDVAISGDMELTDASKNCADWRRHTKGASLVFANLEIPISSSQDYAPVHRASKESMRAYLLELGITHVSLANNHIFDSGEEGLKETIQLLDDCGIMHTGAGGNLNLRAPILDEVDGIKIAIFAYAVEETNIKNYNKFPGWVNTWNEIEILEWVNLCKKEKRIIIFSIHWGTDYAFYPNQQQFKYSNWLWEIGVDLVIGHHAHVVQPMMQCSTNKNQFVFFGLGGLMFGNFLKNGEWNSLFSRTKVGLILGLQLDDEKWNFEYSQSKENWSHSVKIRKWNFKKWSHLYLVFGNWIKNYPKLESIFIKFDRIILNLQHQFSEFGNGFIGKWIYQLKYFNRRRQKDEIE